MTESDVMGRTSDARERLIEAMSALIWLGSYGSTSVDQICDRAKVKKGSFYHYFACKTDLALAVIDEASHEVFVSLDRIYSPTVPPLNRIRDEARWRYKYQKEISEKFGRVLGCPLFSLGAELGTREEMLTNKIKEILDKHLFYYESALRDAQRQKLIAKGAVEPIARRLLAYAEGMLTQARIHNDLSYIAEIEHGFMAMLDILAQRRAI
jgi:TetR/AcrR family transcriptional regulator, transcriptional repressor for nem operon